MSRAEVIEAVNAMDSKDRTFVAAYLKAKELSESVDHADHSSNRLSAMQDGNRIDSSSLREIHDSLEKQGI